MGAPFTWHHAYVFDGGTEGGKPMLKITLHDAVEPLRLELEGRLAGAWVCE